MFKLKDFSSEYIEISNNDKKKMTEKKITKKCYSEKYASGKLHENCTSRNFQIEFGISVILEEIKNVFFFIPLKFVAKGKWETSNGLKQL